ncbi:MAG: hypothetical protein ACSLE3_07280 [Microbacteriaceae bacterium]
MGVATHVMQFSSGWASTKGSGSSRLQFVSPLRQLNGVERWFVTFYALPAGRSYDDVRYEETPEYIQAGGRAERLMLDIRKCGDNQWGADAVRYVIGHALDEHLPLDVPIELTRGPEFVSAAEVFEAEEAADIFYAYYQTGDIPPGYVLRPVEAYTDGRIVDLRSI